MRKTSVWKIKFKPSVLLEVFCLLFLLFLLALVNISNSKKIEFFNNSDISYEFNSALDIKNGINPYNRILKTNFIDNEKYATLFPLYYYLILVIEKLSGYSFVKFVSLMRFILITSEFLGALFIYLYFARSRQRAIGYFGAAFYLFNVYTINSYVYLKQDVIAIAFLMFSLYFFKSRIRLSYFLFGLSLGIKHIGIFVLPYYFLPLIFRKRKLNDFLQDLFCLVFPILVPSFPCIFNNARSFVYSMIFSLTRSSEQGNVMFGYSNLLSSYSMLARLPLFIASGFNLVIVITKKIHPTFYILTSFLIFSMFNPVIFDQYLVWVTAFVFISLADR